MEWWEVLLAIVFTVPWIYVFIKEVIIDTIIDNYKYNNRYRQWNKSNPDLIRINCKDCKYCRSRTNYIGRYPNGFPERIPEFCSLLKRKTSQNSSCMIAEPTAEFYKKKDEINPRPNIDTEVFFLLMAIAIIQH